MDDYVMYQVDMAVLENTKEYLIQRFVQCHNRGHRSPNDVVVDHSAPVGNQQYQPNFLQSRNELTTIATTTEKTTQEVVTKSRPPVTKASPTAKTVVKVLPKSK